MLSASPESPAAIRCRMLLRLLAPLVLTAGGCTVPPWQQPAGYSSTYDRILRDHDPYPMNRVQGVAAARIRMLPGVEPLSDESNTEMQDAGIPVPPLP